MTDNKRAGFLIIGVLLITSASVWAVDEHHPATASQPSVVTPTKTALATANSADTEKRFEQTRQQMKKIQAQMDKIHQTKDPKERQRLVAKHIQAVQDTMQAMHGMGGPVMMNMTGDQGVGAGGAAPMVGGSGMPIEQRMNMMGNRIDMIQVTMGQMPKQQEPSKKPRRCRCGKVNVVRNWSTDVRDVYLLTVSSNLRNI